MNKIKEFNISIERLTKVWQSKIDFGEEVLVVEDMHWLVEIFDKFFIQNNINEFININGRYTAYDKKDGDDYSDFFKDLHNYSIERSNKQIKYIEPDLDEINKTYNNFINRDIQYNIIDIFLNTCKRLYGRAIEKELKRTQNLILWVLRKIFFRMMTFESKSLDSEILVQDFLTENILEYLNEKELKNLYPSKDFVCFTLFIAVLEIYYESKISSNKATYIRLFLLKSWERISFYKMSDIKNKFIKELSRKSIYSSLYKDPDIYSISRMIVDGSLDHPHIVSLRKLEEQRRKIISKNDFDTFQEIYNSCLFLKLPKGIDYETHEYFVKTERDLALQLYKFRELQLLILEILSQILNDDGIEEFQEALLALQKKDQFSNYLSFFPTTEDQLIVWIFLLKNIKSELSLRIESSSSYRHLNNVLNFFVLNFFSSSFNSKNFGDSLRLFEISNNYNILNSLKNFIEDLIEVTEYSEVFTAKEKERITEIWEKSLKCLDEEILNSETSSQIPPVSFSEFKDSVLKKYEQESFIFKIRRSSGMRTSDIISEFHFQTEVARNDFIFRKHFIPNWHLPFKDLSNNVAKDLSNQEILQFEIQLFHEFNVKILKIVSRKLLADEINKLYRPSFILFKNSFPQYWLKSNFGYNDIFSSQNELFGQHSVYNYKTFDANPELIIIPRNSIYVVGDADLGNPDFNIIEDSIQWSMLDLAIDDSARFKIYESPPEFLRGDANLDHELKKYLWLRIVVANRITINPKDILRFKLDPYVE